MRKGKIGKRFLSIILACLMLTSMVPFAAFANETGTEDNGIESVIYVDATNGADTNEGTSEEAAVQTIETALDKVQDGATIQLAAGEYVFTSGLNIGKAVNLEGVAGETTIKGQVTYTATATASDNESITVSGITFAPAEGGSNHQGLNWVNHGTLKGYKLNVNNCVFDGWQFAIGVNSGADDCTLNVSNTQFINTQVAMGVETSKNHIGTLTNVQTTSGCYAVQAFKGNGSETNNYYNTIDSYVEDAKDSDLSEPDYDAAKNGGNPTFTTGTPVAKVNGGFYDSLEKAVKAATDGQTVTLVKDVVLDGEDKGDTQGLLTIDNKNLTIDGNGYTISAKNVTVESDGKKGPSMINIQNGANVTVKNLTIDGGTDETFANGTKHGLNIFEAGTVTLDNVTIENNRWYAVENNGSDVVLNGLTTQGNQWGINVDSKNREAKLTVNNAVISEKDSIVLEKGEAEESALPSTVINGGELQYVISKISDLPTGNLTVTGGKFATGTYANAVNIIDYVPEGYYYNPSTGTVAERPTSPGTSNYPVNIKSSTNGTVSVAKADEYANAGETIVVTVTPDAGYKLDKLTVSGGVDVTDNEDGTYSFTMPASAVTITATFVEDPDYVEPTPEPEPTPDPTPSMPFTDVNEGDWFYDVVQYAYENGLMTGTSATTFEPNTSTTRGMIVAVLNRLEGGPTAEAAGFTDVNAGDWYADAVNWAASVGIVNGFEDNTFRANDPITREQMAAILYNYADYKGYDVSERADLSGYADADSISSWALDTLEWANAEGLITGMSADTIAPQGQATRAQVAAMFERFIENIAE